jgi:hypothetical protein
MGNVTPEVLEALIELEASFWLPRGSQVGPIHRLGAAILKGRGRVFHRER